MKDKCRIRVLELLKTSATPAVLSEKIVRVLPEFPPAKVEGTLIELSFEGLVKIDYVPMITITPQGRQE